MIAKVSDLAAKVLIEGWYQENCREHTLADTHFPAKAGDVVDLDCAYLIREVDGWYISNYV